jgi:uncharacterized protein YjbI with pentapeptide repeats
MCKYKDCELENFENSDYCILHCKKDGWNKIKVNKFWKYIQNELDGLYGNYVWDVNLVDKNYTLKNVIFPSFQDEVEYCEFDCNEIDFGTNFYSYGVFEHYNQQPMPEINSIFNKLKVSFESCIFLDIANFKKYTFSEDIVFKNCKFNSKMLLNAKYTNKVVFLECTFLELDCSEITFEDKVEIKDCLIESKINFQNTRFKKLADFNKTKFNSVDFTKTTFEDISVFSESVFAKKVDFKYTTFSKLALFRKTKFAESINFEDSIIKEDINFLEASGKKGIVKNRETARIIKNSFEKQNNIIEANKFYAMEMQKQEEELNKNKSNNYWEWLVFKIHGLSSNHSQNYLLPIFWIFIFGIASALVDFYSDELNQCLLSFMRLIIFIPLIFWLINIIKSEKFSTWCIFLTLTYSAYTLITRDFFLSSMAKSINPFSIMNGNDKINMLQLMLKVIIAYLIYQFIISVRQNTRRK